MVASLRTRPVRVFLALLVAVLAVVGVVLGTPARAAADTDDFTFDSFHAEMELSRGTDGHAELAVTETIVARFPDFDQNRGIVRAIPDEYQNVPLHTEVLGVTDADGAPVPYEIERDGDFIEVLTGDDSYVQGEQTYVVSYTQRDSIRVFEDTDADEFYRDINGTGWDQPFGIVSATISVDADLTDELTGNESCYYGPEGSTEQCTIVEGPREPGTAWEFRGVTESLEPGENMTFAIGFERGTFVPGEVVLTPTEQFALDAAPVFAGGSIAALIASILAVAGGFLARRPGRDAAGRGVIVAEYAPPREVSVLQAAHLVGRAATAVPAGIIDLAVAGHLRIVAPEDAKKSEITLEYSSPAPEGSERERLLSAVFGVGREPGARAWLGRGDTQALAKELDAVSNEARDALRTAGLTEKQKHGWPVAVFLITVAVFFVALTSLIFSAIAGAVSWVSITALIVSVLTGVITAGMWRLRDRVTDAGAPIRDHLLGLRDYLQLAEADRIRMLQSPAGAERRSAGGVGTAVGSDTVEVVHLYEKLLPYAVIWGVEKEWAHVLETRANEADLSLDWYRGPGGFSSVYFLTALATTRNSTSVAATTWAASGGSSGFSGGSMGGGFSGGGAGGGGGGGR